MTKIAIQWQANVSVRFRKNSSVLHQSKYLKQRTPKKFGATHLIIAFKSLKTY